MLESVSVKIWISQVKNSNNPESVACYNSYSYVNYPEVDSRYNVIFYDVLTLNPAVNLSFLLQRALYKKVDKYGP